MISPCLDWMMCCIPSIDSPAKEILDTALICMYDGNASYMVRHLDPLRHLHELDLIVQFVGSADQVFDQLKKRILEFEAKGVPINFCILGVRHSDAPNKWHATFLLDDPKTYWPWTHNWGHPHGTVEPESPLLNFENLWKAVKPYACRLCYNSDHYTQECSLPCIKIGGVALVSLVSPDRVLRCRFPERMTIIDQSLEPAPPAPRAPQPDDDPTTADGDAPDDAPDHPGDTPNVPGEPDAPHDDMDIMDDDTPGDGHSGDQGDESDPDSESSSSDDGLPPCLSPDTDQVQFFSHLLSRLPAPKFTCNPLDVVSQSSNYLGTAMHCFATHFTSLPPWDKASLYRDYASFLEQPAVQTAPLATVPEESVCILF